MKVDGASVKICFAIAVIALSCIAASGAERNSPDISRTARLVELESSRALAPELLHDVLSTDHTLAARAALALGRTKDPRAEAPLARMFGAAHDPGVRAMAMYGMGLLADRVALDTATIERGLRDRDSIVRAAAVDAAQRIVAARRVPAARLIEPLVGLMQRDASSIVRARAAVALAAFADMPQASTIGREVIDAFEREREATVRWHEAWALGRAFPSAVSRARLDAGLTDRDDLVRMEFLIVAGRSSDPTLAHAIEALVHDPSWRVAEQATESLRRLAGGTRTEHLGSVPDGILTPPPDPQDTSSPLPRPVSVGPPQKPTVADLGPEVAFRLGSAASALDGPLPGLHPRVRIGTTKGTIVVRLYPEWAPLTVANFLSLVNRGYYDRLRWFRIVPNFVAQTGDPKNTGDGDAGYMIPSEENPLEQRAGVLSMGLNYEKGDAIRDSAGTQFYLTMSPQMHLNRAFTVFGEIESGFNVLGRLVESDTLTKVEQIGDDEAPLSRSPFDKDQPLKSEPKTKRAFSLRSMMRR